MRKHVAVVLIALLAVPMVVLAAEEKKPPAKAYDEVKYYRNWALSSYRGFEPSFIEEVPDPSKVILPTLLLKVYRKAGKVVRHDLLSVRDRNRPELLYVDYYYYNKEGRLWKKVNYDRDGDVRWYYLVTKWDSEGRPLRLVLRDGDAGEIDSICIYSYDDEGRIAQAVLMEPANKVRAKALLSYDEQGELLSIKVIEPGKKDKVYKGFKAHAMAFVTFGF